MLERAQALLKQYYGYDEFRPGQAKVINSLLAGRDVLAVMPTGAGKSICFQIPALLLPGITLVVSPLISLMKDQVDSLNNQGISAVYINSSMSNQETQLRLRELAAGQYKMVYVAPERLELASFQAVIALLDVSMVAIDEAHCVSQWGHDFRPSYRNIHPFVSKMPKRPVVGAFTATATPEVKTDIVKALSLKQPEVYVTGFDRPNLSFTVIRGENKQKVLLDYVKANARHSGIIYASTRREVEELHAFLRQRGYAAGRYHAGLDESERTDMQEQFLYDDIRIMVATNAFGMGIDKSNVRYVIHYNMPRNMEAYYQEAGRSGRDGEPGECILLFGQQDIVVQRFLIQKSVEHAERRQHELRRLQDMIDYCHTQECLRHYILRYFGQTPEFTECGNCGTCCGQESEPKASYTQRQMVSQPAKSNERPASKRAGKPRRKAEDEDLFEVLRKLRREIAQREKVPPYVVFSDSTLKDMCGQLPSDTAEFRRIKGVGELKLEKYGHEFLTCIRDHVEQQGGGSRSAVKNTAAYSNSEKKSHLVTLEMFREGLNPQEIARLRGLSLHTLNSHLARCQQEGYSVDWI